MGHGAEAGIVLEGVAQINDDLGDSQPLTVPSLHRMSAQFSVVCLSR